MLSDQRLGFGDGAQMRAQAEPCGDMIQIGRMHAAFFEQIEPGHQMLRRVVGDHAALADQQQPVASAQLLGFVLDHHQAQPLLAQPADQREDFGRALGVEIGGRLVENDHRGPQRHHGGDREALFFSTRKRGRVATLESLEADRRERVCDPADHLGARHPDLLHREGDFVLDVGREKLRLEVLEHHPDHRGDVGHARAVERAPADPDHAVEVTVLKARDDAIEALGERGLARARGAHDSDHLATRLPKSRADQRGVFRAVIGEGDILELDRDGRGLASGGGLRSDG